MTKRINFFLYQQLRHNINHIHNIIPMNVTFHRTHHLCTAVFKEFTCFSYSDSQNAQVENRVVKNS
jgi:hypothetical protein